MSIIDKRPFIVKLLDTLSTDELELLRNLINGSSDDVIFRSLRPGTTNPLTIADKGIKDARIEISGYYTQTMYTGYLIYNDIYCVLISYSNKTSQILTMVDMADTNNVQILPCSLSILELRSELNDRLFEKGADIDLSNYLTKDGGTMNDGAYLIIHNDTSVSYGYTTNLTYGGIETKRYSSSSGVGFNGSSKLTYEGLKILPGGASSEYATTSNTWYKHGTITYKISSDTYTINLPTKSGTLAIVDWDTEPTQNSDKPITSGGVYTAMSNRIRGIEYTTQSVSTLSDLYDATYTIEGNKRPFFISLYGVDGVADNQIYECWWEKIDYTSATIYLYFRKLDELKIYKIQYSTNSSLTLSQVFTQRNTNASIACNSLYEHKVELILTAGPGATYVMLYYHDTSSTPKTLLTWGASVSSLSKGFVSGYYYNGTNIYPVLPNFHSTNSKPQFSYFDGTTQEVYTIEPGGYNGFTDTVTEL